ncbi:protein S100-G-like [Anolis sagrei]|uniref:protein S100-G-like n=1 Tax=Anolis sagrei TaxID=38937 RepID=UPI00351F8AEF
MTEMEKAMDTIIKIFHQYSTQKSHPEKLSKGETKVLIQKELPGFLKNQLKPRDVEDTFKELDQDPDVELCFREFMVYVYKIMNATHKDL